MSDLPRENGSGGAAPSSGVWAKRDFVSVYATRSLRPPEIVLLLRYAEELGGRLLELGCGAGRITGYLSARGGDVLGIDISSSMIDYCRRRYPDLEFQVGDLADLSARENGSRDVIVAEFNVLGVLDDVERKRVLREFHRVLAPEGLLLFSAHNLAYIPQIPAPVGLVIRSRNPARVLWNLGRLPLRVRNHRRVRRLERHEGDYALVNDQAHDYQLLHYYIGRDAQSRQLEEAGFELLQCVDGDGRDVFPGEAAAGYAELHYAARALP
jgi:SAM-dependent methyltransferase